MQSSAYWFDRGGTAQRRLDLAGRRRRSKERRIRGAPLSKRAHRSARRHSILHDSCRRWPWLMRRKRSRPANWNAGPPHRWPCCAMPTATSHVRRTRRATSRPPCPCARSDRTRAPHRGERALRNPSRRQPEHQRAYARSWRAPVVCRPVDTARRRASREFIDARCLSPLPRSGQGHSPGLEISSLRPEGPTPPGVEDCTIFKTLTTDESKAAADVMGIRPAA